MDIVRPDLKRRKRRRAVLAGTGAVLAISICSPLVINVQNLAGCTVRAAAVEALAQLCGDRDHYAMCVAIMFPVIISTCSS